MHKNNQKQWKKVYFIMSNLQTNVWSGHVIDRLLKQYKWLSTMFT